MAVSLARFIAHLVNQQVASELLVLQLIFLLLEHPTSDSVEIAVTVTKECGQYLSDECSEGLNRIYSPINSLIEVFDAFRHMLQEGEIEKRTQYVIEQLFAVRRTHFQEYPRLAPELDLVEDGDQITHRVGLDDKIDKEEYLDVFHVEEKFEENEETWKKIKSAILGESESEEEGSEEESW